MSNKLIITLNIDYGKSEKGDEVEMDYLPARDLVNAGGAKLVCYADERKAKEAKEAAKQSAKEARPSEQADERQTKEDKQAAKIKTK